VVDRDDGDPAGSVGAARDGCAADPFGLQRLHRQVACVIGPDLTDEVHGCAQARGGHRLVGAFPAHVLPIAGAQDRLTGPWQVGYADDVVDVCGAGDGNASHSGLQATAAPAPRAVGEILDPVVETVRAPFPELEHVRHEAVPA